MRSFPIASEIIRTRTRAEMIDVTETVQRLVARYGGMEGVLIAYCPHPPPANTIKENAAPDVKHDLLSKLEKLIPQIEPYYQHDEGNSDSHVKTSLVGN